MIIVNYQISFSVMESLEPRSHKFIQGLGILHKILDHMKTVGRAIT